MFEKAMWIKCADSPDVDGYAEFLLKVPNVGREIKLCVSCDGAFAAFINDEILPAAFSACADMLDYKLYDCFDLSGKIKRGDEIKLQVWHEGKDTANYIAAPQGVIIEMFSDDEPVLCSDENTLYRKMTEYKNGYKKKIANQLGFSFFYDATKKNLHRKCHGWSAMPVRILFCKNTEIEQKRRGTLCSVSRRFSVG